MLTPKQEQFVKNIVLEGMNYSDAYRSAYNTKGMTDKTINEKACRLKDQDNIRARIEEIRAEIDTPKIMSVRERLELLSRIARGEEPERDTYFSNGELVEYDRPASLRTRREAIDTINKMTGEYVQKVVADVDTSYNINIELCDDE